MMIPATNQALKRVFYLISINALVTPKILNMYECKEALVNKYDDYSPNSVLILDKNISQTMKGRYDETISLLLSKLEKELPRLEGSSDISVYTGSSGIALLHFFLAIKTKNKELLMWPQNYLASIFKNLKGRRECFLNGDGGPLALGAVIFSDQNPEMSKVFLDRLVSLHLKVINKSAETPDELLYGRVGYLYSLLFVNKYIGPNTVNPEVIRKVVMAVLQSGQQLAQEKGISKISPLQYEWHGKNYLGGAHGTAGILYMLLQAKDVLMESELETLIAPTIDHLLELQFRSGNFPSSLGNDKDRLVQWCHGAPGFVQLLSKAYQVYGKEKYLKAALESGEVVWRRGLLSKGYSICHGVSGNGYTFLQLYQITGDLKHLHRAACFGEWCTNWPANQNLPPDRPFSLFEGIAGIIYFLTDLKEPVEAAFPAYTLL
ncbi:lanC-like protein 2 [Lycorma delicatula]|uniref:lanC-like protein 2 n=1 Tax=Lycorma delicatula TaxID=130591 RepID=UPI003F515ECF